MKRSRFSDEQIIAMLKENEAGAKVDDICRRHGVSGATFYGWRKKFGGMERSDAKRLRELDAENAKLKRIGVRRRVSHTDWRAWSYAAVAMAAPADQMLDMSAMKELLQKHW